MKGIGVRIIETEADLAAGAARLVALEPRFAPVVAAGPLPLRRRADGFAALLSAIVAQQVSTASAAAIWGRVEAAGLDREGAWTRHGRGADRLRAQPPQAALRTGAGGGGDRLGRLRDADTEEVVETLVACRASGAGRRRSTPSSRSAMPMSSPRAIWPCRRRAAAVRSAGPALGARACAPWPRRGARCARLPPGRSGSTTGGTPTGRASCDAGFWITGARRRPRASAKPGDLPARLWRGWQRPAGPRRSAGAAHARHGLRRARTRRNARR
jgi:hypothetical protein